MLMMMFEKKLEDLANNERDTTQRIMPKKNVQKMNNTFLRMIKKEKKWCWWSHLKKIKILW